MKSSLRCFKSISRSFEENGRRAKAMGKKAYDESQIGSNVVACSRQVQHAMLIKVQGVGDISENLLQLIVVEVDFFRHHEMRDRDVLGHVQVHMPPFVP